jgi:hypothetical protein
MLHSNEKWFHSPRRVGCWATKLFLNVHKVNSLKHFLLRCCLVSRLIANKLLFCQRLSVRQDDFKYWTCDASLLFAWTRNLLKLRKINEKTFSESINIFLIGFLDKQISQTHHLGAPLINYFHLCPCFKAQSR